MWRDPLDELIADLERTVTPQETRRFPDMGQFVIYVDTLANGPSRAVAGLRTDAGFRRFLEAGGLGSVRLGEINFDAAIADAKKRERRSRQFRSGGKTEDDEER
jgi:hypothetical protein